MLRKSRRGARDSNPEHAFDVAITFAAGPHFLRLRRCFGYGSVRHRRPIAEEQPSTSAGDTPGFHRARRETLEPGVMTGRGSSGAERLLGLHLNFIPGSYEPDMEQGRELSIEEKQSLAKRADWFDREGGYSHVQRTKPDTLGPALNDSPVGLAAWIVDKFRSWSDCDGDIERRFSRDEILTTVSLYWFTRTMPSAIRLYWESRRRPLRFAAGEKISVPVGIAHFPRELPIPAKAYVERGYNITHWSEMPRGGHFCRARGAGNVGPRYSRICRRAALGIQALRHAGRKFRALTPSPAAPAFFQCLRR